MIRRKSRMAMRAHTVATGGANEIAGDVAGCRHR
jgi:hypothetical protein